MSVSERYAHDCAHCRHENKVGYTLSLTFVIRQDKSMFDKGHHMTARKLSDALVELMEHEPGWLTANEGADWHISAITGVGGVLYRGEGAADVGVE